MEKLKTHKKLMLRLSDLSSPSNTKSKHELLPEISHPHHSKNYSAALTSPANAIKAEDFVWKVKMPVTARNNQSREGTSSVNFRPARLKETTTKFYINDVSESKDLTARTLETSKEKNTHDLERQLVEYISSLKESKAAQAVNENIIVFPEKSDIYKCMRILELLSEEKSLYTEAMQLITAIFKRAIYANRLFMAGHASSFEGAHCKGLRESFSKFEEKKLTYFNLCEILFKEITKRERDSSQKDAETQNFQARKKRLFASLTDSTQELQAKIADYEENLEQVKKELWSKLEKKFIVRLESEKKELQDRIASMLEDYDILSGKYQSATQENLSMHNELEESNINLKQMRKQERELKAELEMQKKNLNTITQRFKELQTHANGFKETLDMILIQVASIRNVATALKAEKEQLVVERDALKIRAAVGFEQLTPRPDYRKIMEENNLTFNIQTTDKSTNGAPKLSTIQTFQGLVNRYNELLKKNKTLESEVKFMRTNSPSALSQRSGMGLTIDVGDKARRSLRLNEPASAGIRQKTLDDSNGGKASPLKKSALSKFKIANEFITKTKQAVDSPLLRSYSSIEKKTSADNFRKLVMESQFANKEVSAFNVDLPGAIDYQKPSDETSEQLQEISQAVINKVGETKQMISELANIKQS